MMDEDSVTFSGENEFKLQVIHRIMKKTLPNHALVSKDAKSFVEEKAVAFIRNLTRKARKVAGEDHRTKIKGQDLIKVFENSGLWLYKNVLDAYLEIDQNRDTPSESTETDAYEEEENMEEPAEMRDHDISNAAVPQNASGEDMFSDPMVLDTIPDPSNCFEVPERAEKTFIGTTERDEIDLFGGIDEVDLMGEENILSDCVRMPDSWIAHITQHLKYGATPSPQIPSATDGADLTSDFLIPVSVPSWTLKTKLISGIVMPSIDIPAFTVHVSNGADPNGADADALVANSSLVNSPSPEIRRISIPAWKILSTTVSGVHIPPIDIPSITALGRGDVHTLGTDIGATDVSEVMHTREERSGEEPSKHNSICEAQDGRSTPDMKEIGYTNTSSVEAEQVLNLQEPTDPFVFRNRHNFDAESLLDYMQGFVDE